jgi:TatD DNase family protein
VIDSHCHLADETFSSDLAGVVTRAREAGVEGALVILEAGNEKEASQAETLQQLWPETRFGIGVHPHQAHQFAGDPGGAATVVREQLARTPAARAVGEIGLDYHYNRSPPKEQRSAFREQIVLAHAVGLPIVIHTREAWDDTFAILRDENAAALGGAFHCFSGGPEEAKKALATGFFLSFAGPLTFRNADALREAAALVPPDRLLIETDAPYLTPHPHRGERNEPARVGLVGERLAAIHGVPPETLADTITGNLDRLFRIAEARSSC